MDFVKIAQDSKLLDFGNAMGWDGIKQQASKKQQRTYNNNVGTGLQGGKVGKKNSWLKHYEIFLIICDELKLHTRFTKGYQFAKF